MSLDLTKPVQTRDGRKVRILCTDMKGVQPVVAIVTDSDGDEWQSEWSLDGSFYMGDTGSGEADLINVIERLKGWVNLYEPLRVVVDHIALRTSHAYPTRELADQNAEGRIGVAYIDTERL